MSLLYTGPPFHVLSDGRSVFNCTSLYLETEWEARLILLSYCGSIRSESNHHGPSLFRRRTLNPLSHTCLTLLQILPHTSTDTVLCNIWSQFCTMETNYCYTKWFKSRFIVFVRWIMIRNQVMRCYVVLYFVTTWKVMWKFTDVFFIINTYRQSYILRIEK